VDDIHAKPADRSFQASGLAGFHKSGEAGDREQGID